VVIRSIRKLIVTRSFVVSCDCSFTFIVRWRWQPPYGVFFDDAWCYPRQDLVKHLWWHLQNVPEGYRPTGSSLLSSTINWSYRPNYRRLSGPSHCRHIVDVFLFVVAAVFYAFTTQFPGDTSIVQLAMQHVLQEGPPLPS